MHHLMPAASYSYCISKSYFDANRPPDLTCCITSAEPSTQTVTTTYASHTIGLPAAHFRQQLTHAADNMPALYKTLRQVTLKTCRKQPLHKRDISSVLTSGNAFIL